MFQKNILFSLSQLVLRSMQDPGLLHGQFPGSNTHFLQIIFNTVQPSLTWLSNGHFPFWDILQHFFRILSSCILSTCPNQHNVLSLIFEIISGRYIVHDMDMVRTLQTT
jgi:hypothetical protein